MPHSYKRNLLLLLMLCLCQAGAYAALKADFTVSGNVGCSPVVASFTNTSTGAVSYLWRLGNGNTSTSANPGAIYSTPGTYTVTLIAKDASGNLDSVTKTNIITVYQNPDAGFKADNLNGCNGLSVTFTDTTHSGSGAITSWAWDFGDGSVSSSQSPTHTFLNAGQYTISLVVSNTLGCKSTVIRTNYITILQRPTISITANQTLFCDSVATVKFKDLSSNEVAGKTTWLWRFGDGTTSTQQNPTHVYTNWGNYNVRLIVTVAGACADSFTYNSYVSLTKYHYDFKADKPSGCGLYSIKFTNLSNPIYGWMNFTWDFGDGTTSNLINPNHIYLDSGTYTVKLISNATLSGCLDTVVKKDYINIGVQPHAAFFANDSNSCGAPFTVHFTNTSNKGAVTWSWDFGDGNTSTDKNPVHTYTAPGKYTVTLTAKTSEGCPDVLSVFEMIKVVPPKAMFTSAFPKGCKDNNAVVFTNQSTSQSPVGDYIWYFGDGDTSHSKNPVHHYADTGKYTVSLVVKTKDSCQDSLGIVNFVKIGLKPTASFKGSPLDSCIQDMTVHFISYSDTFPIKPDEYLWEFGDGFTGTTKTVSHFYNDKPNFYTVRLIVTSNGCPDTLTRTNYIHVHGPKADFSFFQKPCVEDSVYFTNKTLGGNQYFWDFGDGNTSNAKTPVHWYSAPGVYTIKLHASDTVLGCWNDTSFNVDVPDLSKYKPGFSTDITSGCYPITVNFLDTSLANISSQWSFGNGSFTTGVSPTATYTEPGYYTVTLTTTNVKGCRQTLTRTNYIKAFGVVPSFDICSPQECGVGSVKFTDFTNAPDPVKTRVWNFGDGNTLTTTDTIVNHAYASLQPNQFIGYDVKLTVTDSAGCSASKDDIIRQTKPIQKIFKQQVKSCGAMSFSFSPINTISQGITPYVFKWRWEHEPLVTAGFYSRTVTDSGTYHITLIYTDYYGCTDSTTDSVIVKVKKPQAGFNQSDTFSSCPPLEIQFTDTSIVGSNIIQSYKWDFGDGTASTLRNPKKLFVLPGKYTVKLTISDLAGCVSTAQKNAIIHIKGPTGTYSFAPATGCDSVAVTFTAHSSNASKLQWDLGDGTLVNDSNFKHTYFQKDITHNGLYVPRLVLSDTLGCTYSAPAYDTVRVWGKELVQIGVSDSFPCDTGTLTFKDNTYHINQPVSWLWSFGDGSTDTARNPVHRYSTYDTFTVKLVITDSTGCKDSSVKNKWIAVSKQVKPGFGTSALGQCVQQPVTFYDSTISKKFTISSYSWDFDDGFVSNAVTPTHNFSTGGVYQVKLKVTNTHGCSDTTSRFIPIKTRPIAKLLPVDNCQKDSSVFIDSSVSTAGTIASEVLYFGNGDSSLNPSKKYLYSNYGTYQAKLIVTSSYGCIDSSKHVIHIYQKPTAGFTVPATCVYDTVPFTDKSTIDSGTITGYSWKFGDGNTGTATNPKYKYAADGTYTVTQYITSDHGCNDSASATVKINPRPKAAFSFSDVCLVDSAKFTDKSTVNNGTITSWNWDFGDGQNSVTENPAHLYSLFGVYNVTLAVSDDKTCKDTVRNNITIHPKPAAGFTKSDLCYGHPVNFKDTSRVSTGSISSWIWTFGDGSSSAMQNPSHAYATAGTYHVKLVISTPFGCKDSATDSVVIFPKPKAKFSGNTACLNDTTYFHDSTRVTTGSIVSWSWDFGDIGSPANTSALQNPWHLYPGSGTYTVTLIVTTDKGCGDTFITQVKVFPKPVADFSFSNACRIDSVLFTNNSQVSSGSIGTYAWNFGDGGGSVKKDPYHTYAAEGSYTVQLIVSTDKACRDTVQKTITIYPMPKAGFTLTNVCPYDSMPFSNSSAISSGSMTWQWTFGDGGSSTISNPKHLYAADGVYNISLIATSDKGCRDTARHKGTVYPKPKSDFSFNNACKVDSVHFLDKSTVTSGSVNGWHWNFMDGSSTLAQNPVHLYANPGAYAVQFVVTSDKNCKDTGVKNVTIYPMPVAAFTAPNVCYGKAADFKDISTIAAGNITAWSWDFGDGTGRSSVQNPSYGYKKAGAYTVKLVITSAFGCKDSTTRKITIHPKPVAKFGATTECYPNPTRFKDSSDLSSGAITNWTWNFGDGGNAFIQNPNHNYLAGSYKAMLALQTDSGCQDTAYRNIVVNPKPGSLFTVKDVCQVDSAVFTNNSSVSTGSLTGYNWAFGDPSVSNTVKDSSKLTNPKHKYGQPGTFIVTLYATTDKGCKDTSAQNLVIHPMPSAKFGAYPQCQDQPVAFYDSSSVVTGNIITWNWNFGDGKTGSGNTQVHYYTKNDTYTVKQVVITDFGCGDSTTRRQAVWPLPKADFSFTNRCVYDSFSFKDLSTISSGDVNQWVWDFGDGNTSNLQNPRHLYAADGTYHVRLVAFSSFGCMDTVYHDVTVYPKPDVKWGAAPVCFKFDSKLLDSTTIHAPGNITGQTWYLGDGSISTTLNPVHHYAKPDSFTVKLVKVSDKGCKDSLTQFVVVHPLPTSIWTNTTVCERDSTFFTDKSTIRSGMVNAWNWQFGDKDSSPRQNPGHVYPGPGTYQARMVAVSSFGCTDTSKYKTITVHPRSKPGFYAPQVCFKDTTRFTNTTTIILSGKVVSYKWNFGDSGTNILASPVHYYRYPSLFKVTLVTTTDKGCSDTAIRNIRVNHWPSPAFAPSELCLGDTITLINNSSSIDGNITRWHWDFGEPVSGSNDTSDLFSPRHFYQKKGYYDIKLTAYTDRGCQNTGTRRIHVLKLTPKFNVSDTLSCLRKPIIFTDQSLADTTIKAWLWDFGNGSTSTQQNPYYAYSKPGHYDVSLTITDVTGCAEILLKKSRIEILDSIPPQPVPILRATVTDDAGVNIKFSKYHNYDFGTYILKRDMGGGNFVTIFTSANASDTSFDDNGLNTLQNTYTYALFVSDICGNVFPIDSSRTHTTMNVTGSKGVNMAVLDWTPYVGWDSVKRYVIYRQNVYDLLKWDSVGYVDGDSLHFEDTSIICYRTHKYKILAIEAGGHQQWSWSDTTSVTPIYVPNVIKNSLVRATVDDDNTVRIEWTKSKTKRPWNYILERSIDYKNFKQVGVYNRNTFMINDMNVEVGDSSYIYRMLVRDSCGDLSKFTDIAKTILLKIDTPLTEGHPVLNWTPYKNWPLGVDYYEVQWYDDAARIWKTIATLPAVDTAYTDNVSTAKQAEYCYRIIGYSRSANDTIFSVSNRACMPTIMHVYVPNAFTPNVDGKNELFNAKGVFVFEYSLKMYNRWGELLWQTTDMKKGWDGTFEGHAAPEGVYIYTIYARGSNGQTYSRNGNVTLMR